MIYFNLSFNFLTSLSPCSRLKNCIYKFDFKALKVSSSSPFVHDLCRILRYSKSENHPRIAFRIEAFNNIIQSPNLTSSMWLSIAFWAQGPSISCSLVYGKDMLRLQNIRIIAWAKDLLTAPLPLRLINSVNPIFHFHYKAPIFLRDTRTRGVTEETLR